MDLIEDECPICMEKNLALSKGTGSLNGVRLTCCGSLICKSCYEAMQKKNLETRTVFTCPICRSPPPKNDKEDFDRLFQKATLEKRPWAMEMVASMYHKGEGVAKNLKKAFEFFLQAAESGETNSLAWVGGMYREGEGVTQSYEKAFHYSMQAALKNHSGAQCSVGTLYMNGLGVTKSLEKGFEWYLKSAENGHSGGEFNVGNCYRTGEGVDKNL